MPDSTATESSRWLARREAGVSLWEIVDYARSRKMPAQYELEDLQQTWPASGRPGGHRTIEKLNDGTNLGIMVRRIVDGEEQARVWYEAHTGLIPASGAGQSLNIETEWHAESASCRLCLDDEYTEVRRVSQRALGPLFFPRQQRTLGTP